MKITIRDKHTGDEKDFDDLFEFYVDSINIYLIKSKDGWEKPYSFNKKYYEISYIW